MISANAKRTPSGPLENFDARGQGLESLLFWLKENCDQYGDIYKAEINNSSVYVVNSPDLARHVLQKNGHNYKKGRAFKRIALVMGNGLIVSEGDVWKRQRSRIQPAFQHKNIHALTQTILEANLALRRKWEQAARDRTTINVTHDLSRMVLEVTLKAIFGEDYPQLASPFQVLTDQSARDLEFAKSLLSLRKTILTIVERRRRDAARPTDILGQLLTSRDQDNRPMSPQMAVDEIMTMVIAGHETTASSLNWAWFLLSHHPEVEGLLSSALAGDSDMIADASAFKYVDRIIEETLRLYPPVWLLTRAALGDDALGDYFIPAGAEIYISPYIIQRRADLWVDPDVFNPDRFPADDAKGQRRFATLPFSAGARSCIGEGLARMEMRIHLATIAKSLRLVHTGETPPLLDIGVNLRGKGHFIMEPKLKPNSTEVAVKS